MARIDSTPTRQEDGSWAFTWPAGTSPYSVWLDGIRVASGLTTESYQHSDPDYIDTPPPLEVLEDGDTAENYLYPPIVRLQWRGDQNAAGYIVEQYISDEWVRVAQVIEDRKGYYLWTSEALTDDAVHQFRVYAVSLQGGETTPISFGIEIARNPAPPSVSYSVDTAGDIVVA